MVASPRCHKSNDGSVELNAWVFGPDGEVKKQFCLGDGIEHIAIDPKSHIWAGYSDEGVYGNYGWGTTSENLPVGASGLVCFDNDGQRLWEYEPPDGLDNISDCYVLNCAEDVVWLCTYTDFPIVCIDGDLAIKAWRSDLAGPKQIAVNGNMILAYGGYGEKAWDCSLLRLSECRAETISQVRLLLPGSANLKEATVIGRGKFLNLINDGIWYRFEVPEQALGSHSIKFVPT
ncbi:MAG: hypothetical protein JST28_22370 [Acidobacteria bacterium]|nr:hypothetical protein [Acidobacteriota bacterium]